jgi:hypothetical protein
MYRWVALLLVLLLSCASAAGAVAQTGQRVALVIGNGAYREVPRLANSFRDASDVADALRGLGFRVQLVRDATRPAFEAALQRFARDGAGAEIALFFFAGHGIEARGENHLIPVEARLMDIADIDFETVGLPAVLRAMQGAAARLVFLDACRDNPFTPRIRGLGASRSVARGLARVEAADLGTLIAFATAPGTVAADGAGANSPFTAALKRHLAEPGLDVRQVMTRVRRSVVEATGGSQVPWDNSSLVTDVVLRPPNGMGAAHLAEPAPAALTPARPAAIPGTGSGNWVATRRVAAERAIPLPAAIPPPSRQAGGQLGKYLGAWGGTELGGGRHAVVIVLSVDEATGTADILMAASSLNATGPGVQPRAWHNRFVARVTPEAMSWRTIWDYRLIVTTPNHAVIEGRPPPDAPAARGVNAHFPRIE